MLLLSASLLYRSGVFGSFFLMKTDNNVYRIHRVLSHVHITQHCEARISACCVNTSAIDFEHSDLINGISSQFS